jgi:hypothetical protein
MVFAPTNRALTEMQKREFDDDNIVRGGARKFHNPNESQNPGIYNMASGDDGAGKKAKGNEERTDDTWLTVVDCVRPDDAARAILPVIATQPEVDLDVHVDPVIVTAGGGPPPPLGAPTLPEPRRRAAERPLEVGEEQPPGGVRRVESVAAMRAAVVVAVVAVRVIVIIVVLIVAIAITTQLPTTTTTTIVIAPENVR